ncbi:N-acetylglucosamine-6-phosphate deacetylase [Micromonospora sp. NPDC048871]|uniref:N-acetylglucosamine-6-phosphate deacetylase n=1 Tax=Micromonospora sp. NPDC048871 TaxID=3364259 RepID=UPI0037166230
MTVRVNGRVVTPSGVVRQGCVEVKGDRISAVAEYPSVRDGHWIVPGFVDIHNHGGGGHTFTTGDADSARAAAAFHLNHGTTSLLAGLVSAPIELMRSATTAFAPLVKQGVLAGIHFEGPYLSAARCGAQNPQFLRDPSLDELTELVELGEGTVRMVTLAPERDGALAAIEMLTGRGVVAAVGHTDATYEQTRAAIAAGASVGTHVFNGMGPVHHREPGPAVALLSSPNVFCELIADGVHLHDGTLTFAISTAGPERCALITDAMAAAGMPDGEYELGGQAVTVTEGVARLSGDGAIAGSTLTMDAALRHAVAAGLSVPEAVRMVSTTPALAIGLGNEVGTLQAGLRADLVELDEDLNVVRVMRAGAWVQ